LSSGLVAGKIRIQLPPGSTSEKSARLPAFLRRRGLVMRGMPCRGTLS
jgi:hypothetical protein